MPIRRRESVEKLLTSPAMQRSDFFFQLPEHLIAQRPLASRGASRLLKLDGNSGEISDGQFADVEAWLAPGDVLVFNDTKVIPARVFGRKASGGRVEVLVERVLDRQTVLAHVRASKSPKPGGQLILDGNVDVTVRERDGDLFVLEFLGERSVFDVLDDVGHIPLPPYIERADELEDHSRYQTVYADKPGAVAAPTAGLHFDKEMLQRLRAKGVETVFVTLHVGAGTFQPVRVDNIADHQMHAEYLEVGAEACERINAAKVRGSRVVAVGTTSVRSLESAAAQHGGELKPYTGDTRLFITPGCQFQVITAMITNFHLPESTLMMLVSAFGGYDNIMRAYRHAVAAEYRFFSYGDAMLILPNQQALAEK